jgi:hypothetical protein
MKGPALLHPPGPPPFPRPRSGIDHSIKILEPAADLCPEALLRGAAEAAAAVADNESYVSNHTEVFRQLMDRIHGLRAAGAAGDGGGG